MARWLSLCVLSAMLTYIEAILLGLCIRYHANGASLAMAWIEPWTQQENALIWLTFQLLLFDHRFKHQWPWLIVDQSFDHPPVSCGQPGQ